MFKNSSTTHSRALSARALRRGFSLVELLAVMTIISVLLSLASVGIRRMGKGQGVTAGLSLGEGLLAQARSLALNQNTRARLVIHNDLNDTIPIERERYRRMMMVLYKQSDQEGREQQQWTRAGQPTFLPREVYFSPELSSLDMRTGGFLPFDNHQLSALPQDNRQCIFYEFNGQGICTTPGAGFIVENGARPNGQQRPILGGKRDVGGFVILKNGSTTLIRNIERLGAVGTN